MSKYKYNFKIKTESLDLSFKGYCDNKKDVFNLVSDIQERLVLSGSRIIVTTKPTFKTRFLWGWV